MNIAEYKNELANHDWLFYMSDDHRVYVRGHANRDRLLALAKSSEEFKNAYNEAYLEVYSNKEIWGEVEVPLK